MQNCPEITVELDQLSHLSGYLGECQMWTLHKFCYMSILRWAEDKYKYPLCKRRILSVLQSFQLDDDCLEHVTTPPDDMSHPPGGCGSGTSIILEHHKGGLQEGVLRCPAGGIQPPCVH